MHKEDFKHQDYLVVTPPETYGDAYVEHALQQYHDYIETVRWIGENKQRVNSYFLTVNMILFAILGASFASFASPTQGSIPPVMQVVVPAVGAVVNLVWWLILQSYKKRSAVKLQVIRAMERQLPFAPYTAERAIIKAENQGARYWMFKMSVVLPLIFVLLYCMFLIFA